MGKKDHIGSVIFRKHFQILSVKYKIRGAFTIDSSTSTLTGNLNDLTFAESNLVGNKNVISVKM
jgi:hypothetical protein